MPKGDYKVVKTGYTGPEEVISDQKDETLIEKKKEAINMRLS